MASPLEFDVGIEGVVTASTTSTVPSMMANIKSKLSHGSKSFDAGGYSDDSAFVILRDLLQPKSTLSLKSVGKSPFYKRYQRLREYVKDRRLPPTEEEPETYVNYNAFVANIERCHVFETDPTYAIWAMHDALENNIESEPLCIRDSYILGAAQWILWNGQNLFAQIKYTDINLPEHWSPGELYSDEGLLTVHRWCFWADRFRAMAEEKSECSDACKAVAVKAADMMDAFEKNMTF